MGDSILCGKMKDIRAKMVHGSFLIGILFLLQIIPQSQQMESENNYFMEMVMSIRESRNGSCAEIKQESVQLIAAFYYAMSIISRAETYPRINYFTVGVDFCEIVNYYQSEFQVLKNFYREQSSSENDTIVYNNFPDLQAFLPSGENLTLFESEADEIFQEQNITELDLANLTTNVISIEEMITTSTFMPTIPITQKNLFWKKALNVKHYWNKLMTKKTVATKAPQLVRKVKLNRTTTSTTPDPTASTIEPINITELLETSDVEWSNENSMYFNVSKKWLNGVNPQLTVLVEAASTFSVYKDLFLDDYALNNVPIISNNFEFHPHEAELQTLIGDLLECHQWTILSVIYSQSIEEKKRYVNFLRNFQHVCVSEQIAITEESTDTDFNHLVWLLHTNIRNTNVIICFCSRKEIEKLMQAVSRYDVVMPFTFIFVLDGLMEQLNFTVGFEEQLLDSYVIGREIDYVEEFSKVYVADYLSAQRLHPWASEFKMQNEIGLNITTNDTNNNETAEEFLNDYVVNPEVKGIIMGVFAADAALRTYLQPRINSKYFNSNVSFMSIWNDIKKGLNSHEKDLNHNFLSFNKLNLFRFEKFQDGNTTTYSFNLVNDTLADCVNNKEIPLHYMSLNIPVQRSTVFKYECIESCPRGYESISKNMHCLVYDPGEEEWEKVRNCTECLKFPEEDVYGHSMMAPMLISVLGLFLTAMVSQTFVMHNEHPVVKTTCYLSAIMLGCMMICHSIVILISLKICVFTCGVFKYVIPLNFTVMLSAMLVEINRMYRAWEKPPFAEVVSLPSITSKKSAILLMSVLISFESIMIFLYLALGKEKIFHEEYLSTGYEFNLDRLCPLHSDTTLINYFFNAIIVSVTLLYSRVVKSLMRNFYEAKYMYWTMCQTFVLWFAFSALYYKTDLKVLVFSLCVSTNTLIHLLLIFFPKMYIIWFNPDMNDVKGFYNMNEYQVDSRGMNLDTTIIEEKSEVSEDKE
ncbi:metabotropic glutamate receptor 7-like [Planococcus citri]|uniref:metabotropic glutamate receptor 7-like n=1 Tax=Planococcus citri TaxID=170843 RepID=UPI0031F99C01